MKHLVIISVTLMALAGSPAVAQDIVPVGKGSYAAQPPAQTLGESRKAQVPRFLVADTGRALPTNKWWTQLLVSQYARSLWAYPLKVEAHERGLDLFFPTRWQENGRDPVSEFPLTIGGENFHPKDSRAKDWSDWLVSFRMAESDSKFLDVTLGEGMPYVWIECTAVDPTISLPGGADAGFFDRDGKPVNKTVPQNTDCLGIDIGGRAFGIFAPDNTRFALGNTIAVKFSAKPRYLVICPLPAHKDLAAFYRYAFAIPRKTTLSWKYDPAKAEVLTTWTIDTESLKLGQSEILQGWLPHHWRDTANDLKLANLEYLTPRGRLRCAPGKTFSITYPFTGIIPNLPAPVVETGPNPYIPARMHEYLTKLAGEPKYGDDTYWGGKDILRMGQAALMAQQTNDDTKAQFVDHLRAAMSDWFTYTPGESAHFFMYYPDWKALVGYKCSYGSEAFNDHHFHYGYFTQASALLIAHDSKFAADFGDMARLVAKEYANWDHTDARFPFLRTFDVWAGHGWAGGFASPGGNNEESSSEDAQSWAGLIFLGQALGDQDMLSAGAMGYAMESRAIPEYWFDIHDDNFPKEWPHKANGMVWTGGLNFGTYFTGDAAWVYAIQWLPASPALSYLVRDPRYAAQAFDDMIRESKAQNKPMTVREWGAALGNVILGYKSMYDPAWSAAQLDDLWNTPGDDIAHNAGEMTIQYYLCHSMRNLGRYDFSCHTTSATSMVFIQDATKQRTYVAWNPAPKAQTLAVFEGTRRLGQFVAQPNALTSTQKLEP